VLAPSPILVPVSVTTGVLYAENDIAVSNKPKATAKECG
jgi:hypothetical protein